MMQDTVADFPGQVQAFAVFLNGIHDAQALDVVLEPDGRQSVQRPFSGMSERRVPQIVPDGDRLREILVQAQGAGNRPRNLGNFQRVRQACAVMVPVRGKKHLCFVFQAAEAGAVDDASHVALERGAQLALRLVDPPAARAGRGDCVTRELFFFSLFIHFA